MKAYFPIPFNLSLLLRPTPRACFTFFFFGFPVVQHITPITHPICIHPRTTHCHIFPSIAKLSSSDSRSFAFLCHFSKCILEIYSSVFAPKIFFCCRYIFSVFPPLVIRVSLGGRGFRSGDERMGGSVQFFPIFLSSFFIFIFSPLLTSFLSRKHDKFFSRAKQKKNPCPKKGKDVCREWVDLTLLLSVFPRTLDPSFDRPGGGCGSTTLSRRFSPFSVFSQIFYLRKFQLRKKKHRKK